MIEQDHGVLREVDGGAIRPHRDSGAGHRRHRRRVQPETVLAGRVRAIAVLVGPAVAVADVDDEVGALEQLDRRPRRVQGEYGSVTSGVYLRARATASGLPTIAIGGATGRTSGRSATLGTVAAARACGAHGDHGGRHDEPTRSTMRHRRSNRLTTAALPADVSGSLTHRQPPRPYSMRRTIRALSVRPDALRCAASPTHYHRRHAQPPRSQ